MKTVKPQEEVQRSNLSRDPLDILIEKERRLEPCKGCRNDNSYMVFVKRVHGCAIGRRRPNDKCYEDAVSMTCAGGK